MDACSKWGFHGRLNDQVAVVTGGGRGIGQAMCAALAAEAAGVAVVVVARIAAVNGERWDLPVIERLP